MTDDRTRRRFLRGSASTLLAGLAGCGAGDDGDSDGATPTGTVRTASSTTAADRPGVGVDTVADGFTAPTDVAMPAGVERTFIADQPGQVYTVERPDVPLLDLSDRIVALRDGPDERGLLGVAPHPDFASNGRLFVRYSAPIRSSAPAGYSHTFVLAEVTVDPTAEPESGAAEPEDERVLLEIDQPQPNHNAGSLAFGPDGHLFVGVGDGGGGGDVGRGHAEDWYERIRGGNGQDITENLLGSILRLDVEGDPYAVPDDNPLVGADGLDEQWAWGFRNPWRFSVDGDGDSDGVALLVADVGQERYEEVSRVERGENYGWNVYEGTHCFDPSAPAEEPAGCPSHTLSGAQLRDPVIEYPHPGVESGATATGVAVVGGYRYHGPIDEFDGRYVFADWQADGRLFVAEPTEDGLWPVSTVPIRDGVGSFVRAFGRDPDGHLYLLTSDCGGPVGSTGALHRLGT
ncbi:MAG: PQQ-dependent sugar dehydrogenase [Haloplanus sp.]